jgi:hypothetical protein
MATSRPAPLLYSSTPPLGLLSPSVSHTNIPIPSSGTHHRVAIKDKSVLPAPADGKKWEGKKDAAAGTYVRYDVAAIWKFPSAEAFSAYSVSAAMFCCNGWEKCDERARGSSDPWRRETSPGHPGGSEGSGCWAVFGLPSSTAMAAQVECAASDHNTARPHLPPTRPGRRPTATRTPGRRCPSPTRPASSPPPNLALSKAGW